MRKPGFVIKDYALKLVLLAVSFVSLFPFYYMFIMASYFNEEILGRGITLIPGDYLLKNLSVILKGNYIRSYVNSIIVSVFSTASSVLVCAAAGYGLSLYRFRGRRLLKNLIVVTMLLPPQIGIIGYIIEMRFMGLSRTFLPLILTWLPNSFGCFWITQYLDANIQKEIVESARIDGANEAYTFFVISLPLMKAAIVTLVTLTFLWSWNSYMLPLIIVSKASMYTIPLYVMSINGLFRTDYSLQLTALFFATIPLLVIYILGGKHFQRGLVAGAIKG
jgi:multiple sugar transport system permease protein/cellobiose transport system permease protein